jgi:hypothetical protein
MARKRTKLHIFQRLTFAVSEEYIMLEFKGARGAGVVVKIANHWSCVPFEIPHAVVYKIFMVPPLSDHDVACF